MSDRTVYWQGLIKSWARSRLSQAAFCRKRGLSYATFGYWKRRLEENHASARRFEDRGVPARRSAPRGGSGNDTAKFAEVVLPGRVVTTGAAESADRPRAGYEIVLADGLVIRLPGDFDPEKVSQLIDLVAPTC